MISTGAAAVPRLLVAGDPRHGVVRCAREVAAAVGARVGADVALVPAPGDDAGLTGGGPLHLHFTDRLWGADPAEAARRVEALARAVPLTVTLHDLPQPSDGPRNLARRSAAYGQVARAARGVAVSSAHEAELLRDVLAEGPVVEPVLIPLALDVAPRVERGPHDDQVALLGFFYPGKGHAEVVDAVAALAAAGRPSAQGLGVTALGCASAGHEAELDALRERAAAQGVALTVTGYLDDATMLERCRRAAVPVAAHRHLSASGSIGSWIAAGRRPLVPDSRYTREVLALRPGTLAPYAEGELANAVDRARRDPESTWWGAEASPGPTLDDVAAAYVLWWTTGVDW